MPRAIRRGGHALRLEDGGPPPTSPRRQAGDDPLQTQGACYRKIFPGIIKAMTGTIQFALLDSPPACLRSQAGRPAMAPGTPLPYGRGSKERVSRVSSLSRERKRAGSFAARAGRTLAPAPLRSRLTEKRTCTRPVRAASGSEREVSKLAQVVPWRPLPHGRGS